MLRTLSLLLFLALTTTSSPAGSQTVAFLSAIDDLPLMPQLVELVGKGVVFDKPGGRIVEAYAEGNVTQAELIAFYAQTLPQLGWQPLSETSFQREKERLDVDLLSGGPPALIRFTLRPL